MIGLCSSELYPMSGWKGAAHIHAYPFLFDTHAKEKHTIYTLTLIEERIDRYSFHKGHWTSMKHYYRSSQSNTSKGSGHAPSLPNSAVHSSLLRRSSIETVGRAVLTALTKSLSVNEGSSSLSDSTSVHVISMASGSPGEQGVSFSWPSTVT